jgi:glycosyltransferase involved in cell wall biosynthesis
MVFDKHPDWSWDIYGNGELYGELNKNISESGLINNISLKGNVGNLEELYGDYAIYVLTSSTEGLPLVLLEAKAKHLPIISFDIATGPSDIVQNGIDGYLVPLNDIETTAQKICELIENSELRQSFSNAAYLNIGKFDKTKILGEWRELLC